MKPTQLFSTIGNAIKRIFVTDRPSSTTSRYRVKSLESSILQGSLKTVSSSSTERLGGELSTIQERKTRMAEEPRAPRTLPNYSINVGDVIMCRRMTPLESGAFHMPGDEIMVDHDNLEYFRWVADGKNYEEIVKW